VTRRKTPPEQRRRLYLALAEAYRRHADSTTQKEDAAAELGLEVSAFIAALADTRQMGFLKSHE
jgi:hypothetical protein